MHRRNQCGLKLTTMIDPLAGSIDRRPHLLDSMENVAGCHTSPYHSILVPAEESLTEGGDSRWKHRANTGR
jgi:hypothetical protein